MHASQNKTTPRLTTQTPTPATLYRLAARNITDPQKLALYLEIAAVETELLNTVIRKAGLLNEEPGDRLTSEITFGEDDDYFYDDQ